MLISYDKETLDVIFIHPTATEMTEELLAIVGDRDYGTILSDVSFKEYAKPGSAHRLVEDDGVVTFEFTAAPDEPPPAPEPQTPEEEIAALRAELNEKEARISDLEMAFAELLTEGGV